MHPEKPRGGTIVAVLLLLALAFGCWGAVRAWSKASCEARGGHIEAAYGGSTGWTCDGAEG